MKIVEEDSGDAVDTGFAFDGGKAGHDAAGYFQGEGGGGRRRSLGFQYLSCEEEVKSVVGAVSRTERDGT